MNFTFLQMYKATLRSKSLPLNSIYFFLYIPSLLLLKYFEIYDTTRENDEKYFLIGTVLYLYSTALVSYVQ